MATQLILNPLTIRRPEQTISSNDPVLIEGEKRNFQGDKGFLYKISSEDLIMYGSIEGAFEKKN